MRRAIALSLMMLPFVGCAADEVGSDHGTFEDPSLIGSTSQAITVSEMLTRAEEWVALRVPYCGGVRGGTDYLCGGTCVRPAAPWDKYRSDCSGFVSWCWQIASNPTTSVYMSDRSGTDGWATVSIDALTAGDAVVCDGHIKLFSKFVSATSAEIYEEYDCGKVARKTVQSFTRSGNTIKFSGDGRVYHGIRRNNVTAATVVKGYLDKASNTVEGWAVDMNAKSAALAVDVELDTFHLAARADQPRPDVASFLGVDPNHGYALTTPLFFCDGRPHTVRATARPADGKAAVTLTSTPKSLECPLPPVLPGVLRHVINPTSFGAWKFNELAQLRWVSATDATKYEQVAELPAEPDLRRTPDGRVWVIDGTVRRHVSDPTSFAAWGFDDKTVVELSDADASKYNEGPALPARPVLIKTVGEPAVFVLDVRVESPETPAADPILTPPTSAEPDSPNTEAKESVPGEMTGSCSTSGARSGTSSGFGLLGIAIALGAWRRRRVFAALAVVASVGCAGCVGGDIDSADEADDADTSDASDSSDSESPDTAIVLAEDTATAEEAAAPPADVAIDTKPACLAPMKKCSAASECCAGLSCDTTTLGRVCCGNSGAKCSTVGGEDCCGALLCRSGTCVSPDAAPVFDAPFPCGESWTYSHHSAEVRLALDFIDNGGTTNNSPVLASAPGRALRRYEAGGAGNYIVIEHGGGWKTYYFHLQAFSVADGATVTRGQEVGRVGSTGASSGPHLHYEQLKDGVGQTIKIRGISLAPYPSSYGVKSLTSKNCL